MEGQKVKYQVRIHVLTLPCSYGDVFAGKFHMGATYRFIEDPTKPSEVLEWFRALPQPPFEHATADGLVLFFREMGPLVHDEKGVVDATKCPVINLFLPRVRRGVLWTVGEVHFLTTPRQLFPELHKISSRFSRWLSNRDCVFTSTIADNPYDYYFEGSVRNFNRPIFAFASALSALRSGRYFVAFRDNELLLDKVCRALSLRGVECAEA